MEGCVAIYSDLGASFQCLVITSARAYSACSNLRPISWKYIVRPRLLTDEAVNKMMCCCCGKPNLGFSFLRRFSSNEPIYLAKNRFQTNLDSKHLFAIVFIPPAFKGSLYPGSEEFWYFEFPDVWIPCITLDHLQKTSFKSDVWNHHGYRF